MTADTRGNYIEHMIKVWRKCAADPGWLCGVWRIEKMQSSYEQSCSLAIALDGPLGPRHEPKKAGILSLGTKRRRFCRDQRALFFLFPDVLEMGSLCGTASVFHSDRGDPGLRGSQTVDEEQI